jgi:hypothetical protein
MAAAKKKPSASPAAAWVRGLLGWIVGPGRTALVLVLLVGLFGGGAWWAWTLRKDRILASPEYRIGPEQVEVTAQPPWIHSDIRAEVLCSPTLDGRLSLVDDDITERIGNAFTRHPWVWKVERVTKRYGTMKVEIVYRKPVCMVQVPGGSLPVDVEAVLLPPGDFTSSEAARYPQLLGVDREPAGLPGSRWGDAKVIGGAEIAAALGGAWEPMRLRYIEPSAADPAAFVPGGASRQSPDGFAGRSPEPFFTLITDRGTRILWGYAPGANGLGELPAAEKVARLKRYVTKNDMLDDPQGKPQQLDVRTLPPSVQP